MLKNLIDKETDVKNTKYKNMLKFTRDPLDARGSTSNLL